VKEHLISEIRKLTKRIGQAARGGVTEEAERLRLARNELAVRLARDFDTWLLVNAQGRSEFVDRETFTRRAKSWMERKRLEALSAQSEPAVDSAPSGEAPASAVSTADPVREFFGEPISVYTRAQALEDGVLVDVSPLAEGIFRTPVAVTAALWSMIENVPQEASDGRDLQVKERTQELLRAAATPAWLTIPRGLTQLSFPFILQVREGLKTLDLIAHSGPGDRGEPVVTIGFPIDF
jgi:hypothetical protein